MKIYNHRDQVMRLWIEPLGDFLEIKPDSSVILKPNHVDISDLGIETRLNGDLMIWLEGPDCGFTITDLSGNILKSTD